DSDKESLLFQIFPYRKIIKAFDFSRLTSLLKSTYYEYSVSTDL
ncbi:MAG: hypothetical protein ACI97N_002186, partial [Cognaticolwellia sp.]